MAEELVDKMDPIEVDKTKFQTNEDMTRHFISRIHANLVKLGVLDF